MRLRSRVRLAFGVLVAIAVVAVGVLGRAIAWPASPVAGITVAASGAVAVVAGGLALRILVVVDRGASATRASSPGEPRSATQSQSRRRNSR